MVKWLRNTFHLASFAGAFALVWHTAGVKTALGGLAFQVINALLKPPHAP